jgi:ribosome-binding ATPase YchF (GTP1/OBG family)
MHCHVQTVEDIEIQLEINNLEIELTEKELDETDKNVNNSSKDPVKLEEYFHYLEKKLKNLEEHRLRLYWGKKHHMNARNAYWYYLVQVNKNQ